jgi:hypothetical protein
MAAAKTLQGKSGAKRKAANFAAKNNRRGTRNEEEIVLASQIQRPSD